MHAPRPLYPQAMEWDRRDFEQLPRQAKNVVLRMCGTTYLDWEAEAYESVMASAVIIRQARGWFVFSTLIPPSSIRHVARPDPLSPRDMPHAAARRLDFS